MGRRPTFVYAEQPLFVGFSVNVVTTELSHTDDGSSQLQLDNDFSLPLTALTALLNSANAAEWFDAFAKRRGVNLEIGGTVLRRFPLPRCEPEETERLKALSIQRHEIQPGSAPEDIAVKEREIDAMVADLYATRHP